MSEAVLAIDGGVPLRTASMPVWPHPGTAEIEAVTAVLESGRLTYWSGNEGASFEREYAESLGRAHGIAVANGTLALELALRAFGIGAGHEVIVPSRTFIATASAVVAVGAIPVCCDIDPVSNNMTAEAAAAVRTDRTKGIIAVHLGGWPAEMQPILEFAALHGLVVIEDCAQAHGAAYGGRPVGALGSHAAAFSFCQDKIIPIGEGGMLVLDDQHAYERAWAYKDHGKSLEKVRALEDDTSGRSFNWLVDSFGSNWRLAEVNAAIGRAGLRQLPEWHKRRVTNAMRLATGLEGLPALSISLPPASSEHGFYRLYGAIDAGALASGWTRDRIIAAIQTEGIPCQYGSCAEIYREDAFRIAGLAPAERFPGASQAHEESIAFFVHPTLGASHIDDTIAAVRKVMGVAAA